MGRFDLAGRARVALLCARLYVLPVEEEVIPVHIAALENGHGYFPFFLLVDFRSRCFRTDSTWAHSVEQYFLS